MIGTWELDSSENFTEFMGALGKGYPPRERSLTRGETKDNISTSRRTVNALIGILRLQLNQGRTTGGEGALTISFCYIYNI